MLRTPAPRRRRGYTLVEAMVAMGLAVLTMWILAESFRVGMDMIGQSRAAGTMMTQLSSLGALFHRDLVHAHPFLPDDNRPNRGLRLSDQRLDLLNQQGMGWTPPPGGFFRIISNQNGFSPIADDEGLQLPPSYANHALHFTAILPENDTNLFRVNLNGQVFESRAAEVAYFLVDTGTTTSPGGPRLYHLVRRQRLVAVDPLQRQRLDTLVAPASYNDFIASKPALTGQPGSAYTLREIQTPSNRLQVEPPNLPYNPRMTPPPPPPPQPPPGPRTAPAGRPAQLPLQPRHDLAPVTPPQLPVGRSPLRRRYCPVQRPFLRDPRGVDTQHHPPHRLAGQH